jgi:nitrous-oxide reductase
MNLTHTATSTLEKEVIMLDPKDCPDMVYFMPCPKSPHGCDTDPTGEYIVGSGKLGCSNSCVLIRKNCKRQ